jgi:TonB family protein
MIASWMLYTLAIGALITIAAIAADHAFAAKRRPTRLVWAAALALTLAWPLGPVVRRMLPRARPVSVLPFTIVVQGPSEEPDDAAGIDRAAMIDRALVAAWCGLSAALLLRLGFAVLLLRRRRAVWKRARVNGVRVQLSDNVGPAVVGLRSMDVVLPEWIMSLDEPLRAIVLHHEEEHRRARDPYLLFGAAIAAALMPWNPAVWYQSRRLRLAIELDCDARVLRVHSSPERYGMLMLTIAQRRSTSPALYAPMLIEPTTQLERRILAMRSTTMRLAQVTLYGGGAVAVAVLLFASSLQSAGTSFKRPVRLRYADKVLELPPVVTSEPRPSAKPRTRTAAATPPNPAPRYPDLLLRSEIEGEVTVRFASDAAGVPDSNSIQVVSSSHDLFTNAVRKVLPEWHVAPSSVLQMSFVFMVTTKSASDMAALAATVPPNSVVITGVPSSAIPEPRSAEPQRVSNEQSFFEFQVEKLATPLPNNVAPRYPDALRDARIEGEVLVQFVVDYDGRIDMETLKVLRSTDPQFTQVVVAALPTTTFSPALVGGRPVRQLIQMPFHFDLKHDK